MISTHRRSPSLLCESGLLTAALVVPDCDAELQHRFQLETYQRDPTRAAAAKRHAEHAGSRSPKSPQLATTPTFMVTDYDSDSGKSKSRRTRSFPAARSYHPSYLSSAFIISHLRVASLIILVTVSLLGALHLSAVVANAVSEEKSPARGERFQTSLAGSHSRVRSSKHDRARAARLDDEDHLIANGLLHVNMNSSVHPIQHLIKDAQEKWDAKTAQQSKTLRQAMIEYRRRYKQAPPKGFDMWWKYVQEHHVSLPDEYDQIAHDLSPYRALSPADLKNRLETASKQDGTFSIHVVDGELSTSTSLGPDGAGSGRLAGQIALANPIAQYLPDLTVVYSVHDTPQNLISYNHRQDLMEAASGGEFINPYEEIDTSLRGLKAACSSSSPLSRSTSDTVDGKSFIADLSEYTNLCNHPSLFQLHGSLIGKDPAVNALSPIFSLSKTSLHADVLGVPPEQWVDYGTVPAWNDRTHHKLLWRGSNTGMHYSPKNQWHYSQRTRLVALANTKSLETIATLSSPKIGQSMRDSIVTSAQRDLNEAMDVAFTGKPIQCEEIACSVLEAEYHWTPNRMNHSEALDYKYVLDVDGNAWSARLERLLQSGSLIFKSTIMPEWYSERIQPWVHFVPVQVDYSDLYDALAFFRPGVEDQNTVGDALASQIASAGRQWAKSHWRKEDMTAYVFRLYLEWGRLVSPHRESMNFVYAPEMEV